MAHRADLERLTAVASRLGAFVAERHPLALADAIDAFEQAAGERALRDEASIEAIRPAFARELARRLHARPMPEGLAEPTPRATAAARIEQAYTQIVDDCDGFLRRAAIEASLTRDERVEILRGMCLTRATDNRLKTFFTSGEIKYGAAAFQGKGFRSLGQPAIFCLENNQTALSTALADQSAVRVFADKAIGYGIPGITIDGTDPDEIAAAFTWAAERARAGKGPTLIETVSMRMCGHAHHDDMLYLGKDAPASWEYAPATEQGYADREAYAYWAARDPILTYATRLQDEGLIAAGDLDRFKREVDALVEEQARAVVEAPWPDPAAAGTGVFAGEPPRARVEVLDPQVRLAGASDDDLQVEPAPPFDPKGRTLLEAVMLGVGDALRADPRVFVYGQDVGGRYGNAFLLLRPLLHEFGDRILNSPLAEGAVLGVCVGAALAGERPIGEIQFNDFVATGFNQLVNNAAKIRYRWGGSVPMVVRMPWGGLRHAGPYHSQNTEPWFYRTAGLKIVVPSTPHDARALMAAAVADPDPVLYYEHIALYRDPRVRQMLDEAPPSPMPIGRAALRRAGGDLAIVSYGAYVHVALRVAERLAACSIEARVLDLRRLAPP